MMQLEPISMVFYNSEHLLTSLTAQAGQELFYFLMKSNRSIYFVDCASDVICENKHCFL